MPTNKPRVTFVIDDALYEQVQNYQFTYRAKNQSQAICELVEIGIKAILAEEAEKQKAADSADAESAASNVSESGKTQIPSLDQFVDLLRGMGFIVGDDISVSDRDFLGAAFLLFKAHFQK